MRLSGRRADKPYFVVVSPGTITQGVTVTFQAKFTNHTASQTLGSANVTAPAGFSVVGPHVTVSGRDVVQLRNLAVAPGASFIATISATVPSSTPCAPATFTWDVAAKQSNDFNGTGNDFNLLPAPASSLTTSVTCGGTVTQCETVTCQATLPGALASLDVSVADSTGLLTINVGGGLDCAGYEEILPNDVIVNFLPDPGTIGGQKTVTLNISKAAMQASTNNGLSQVNICFGVPAPSTFTVKPGTPALRPTSDGYNIGLLPDCGTPPCVADRQSVGGGAKIVVNAPGGDQDPRYNG